MVVSPSENDVFFHGGFSTSNCQHLPAMVKPVPIWIDLGLKQWPIVRDDKTPNDGS
jgi:hypothetical protein